MAFGRALYVKLGRSQGSDDAAIAGELSQSPTRPPPDMAKEDALSPIIRCYSDTVVASWLTERWQPGYTEGNLHGPTRRNHVGALRERNVHRQRRHPRAQAHPRTRPRKPSVQRFNSTPVHPRWRCAKRLRHFPVHLPVLPTHPTRDTLLEVARFAHDYVTKHSYDSKRFEARADICVL
jgi:hypothetical protein